MVESKTTDKLQLLVEALKTLPPTYIEHVKTFSLTWDNIDGETVIPIIKVEFK